MKNLLIATTALVATAGVAVADVKVSGYGRFGALYNDGVAAGADKTNTASRLRLQFDASTETDGGLTLAVRQRFQTEENRANAGGNGARFSASAGGLTINMGNIVGVIEAAPNLYLPTKSAGVGLEGNGFSSLATNFYSGTALGIAAGLTGTDLADASTYFLWTAYSSGGAGATDGVEAIYSMDGLTVHAHSTDDSYGIGANYKFGDVTAAVAYEEADVAGDNYILFASLGGKFGAFDAAISYGKGVAEEVGVAKLEVDKISLKGGYKANDALYVYGFVTTEDGSISAVGGGSLDADVDSAFGLGASYALGGGASVEAGWTQNEAGDNLVSAGVFFSF